MFTVYIYNEANLNEIYRNKTFKEQNKAFDYVYDHEKGLMRKGGWIAEVRCAETGKPVMDNRLTQLA